jgi:hypothetical protein
LPILADVINEQLDEMRKHHASQLARAHARTRAAGGPVWKSALSALQAALATKRGKGNRFAKSAEERELTGMSALGSGAENLCSMTVLRLMTQGGPLANRVPRPLFDLCPVD